MDSDLVAVLPEGLCVTLGPAEREQETYDEGFVLPAHSVKPLQRLNTHPLDADLEFFEEDHIYRFKGVPTETSSRRSRTSSRRGSWRAAPSRG